MGLCCQRGQRASQMCLLIPAPPQEVSIHIRPRSPARGNQALLEEAALPAPWESIQASGAGRWRPGRLPREGLGGWPVALPMDASLDDSFPDSSRPSLRTAVCSPDYQLQPAALKLLCCKNVLRFGGQVFLCLQSKRFSGGSSNWHLVCARYLLITFM